MAEQIPDPPKPLFTGQKACPICGWPMLGWMMNLRTSWVKRHCSRDGCGFYQVKSPIGWLKQHGLLAEAPAPRVYWN